MRSASSAIVGQSQPLSASHWAGGKFGRVVRHGGADADDLQVLRDGARVPPLEEHRDLVVAVRAPVGEEHDHHRPVLAGHDLHRRSVVGRADERRRGGADRRVRVAGELRERRPDDLDRAVDDLAAVGARRRRGRGPGRLVVVRVRVRTTASDAGDGDDDEDGGDDERRAGAGVHDVSFSGAGDDEHQDGDESAQRHERQRDEPELAEPDVGARRADAARPALQRRSPLDEVVVGRDRARRSPPTGRRTSGRCGRDGWRRPAGSRPAGTWRCAGTSTAGTARSRRPRRSRGCRPSPWPRRGTPATARHRRRRRRARRSPIAERQARDEQDDRTAERRRAPAAR